MPCEERVERELWNWRRANWNGLREELAHTDWNKVFFDGGSEEPNSAVADAAVTRFTTFLLERARRYVPVRKVTETKFTHPWLNDRCVQAVKRKREAEGIPDYRSRVVECSKIF